MSGDYSRWRFDPTDDHNGVLLQQGRPLTDADWNEAVSIANRRLQASRLDTLGSTAVVPLTTPDGFKLTFDANLGLTIGRGRIYVDGLLVECHGGPPLAWDAALAETFGLAPIPYAAQPYFPDAPALPASGGPYLLYLDAWTRELTAVEDIDLVEPALGVDTTTRWQTAWQVRCLDAGAGAGVACDSPYADIAGWAALTAPSAGRLSTGTAVFGTDNPCLVPPSGGYVGLENQLYRVQIHRGGAPGTASFKWSRDNAAVVASVTQIIDPTTLVVDSLGKDSVLGFHAGDWVEVLDDRLELNGQAGELHRIVAGDGVDAALRRITLETPLVRPFVAGANHLRLIRWDQSGQVLRTDTPSPSIHVNLDAPGAGGDIPVPANGLIAIALESGIVVSFELAVAAGRFRSGDWWVFTARTSTAAVETLTKAPPRGTHHHYARLGVYSPGKPVVDCRHFWPVAADSGGCACTICVSPQAHARSRPSLQQAIDFVLKAGGGTVCLGAGVYSLAAPLVIRGATGSSSPVTLVLSGQGGATKIVARGTGALVASGAIDLSLQSLRFRCEPAVGVASPSMIVALAVADVTAVRLQRLTIDADPAVQGLIAVSIAGRVRRGQVLDCDISAACGISTPSSSTAASAIGKVLIDELRIEDSRFDCLMAAVDLHIEPKFPPVVFVHRNRIRSDALGIRLTGGGSGGGAANISANQITVGTDGIVADLHGLRILENDIACGSDKAAAPGRGIVVASVGEPSAASAGACRIVGNRISGLPSVAILVTTPLTSVAVIENQIDRCGGGIWVGGHIGLGNAVINGNELTNIDNLAVTGSPDLLAGISVSNAQQATVNGNGIVRFGVAPTALDKITMAAVLVQQCTAVRVAENRLIEIGPEKTYTGTVLGIGIGCPTGSLQVEANRITQTPQAHGGTWVAILVIPQPNIAGGGLVTGPSAALVLSISALAGQAVTAAAAPATTVKPLLPVAVVQRNDVESAGTQPVVLVWTGSCDFSHNQINRSGQHRDDSGADILLVTNRSSVVGGNHISGPMGAVSIRLAQQGTSYTVLGNITSGGLQILAGGAPPAPLGLPWGPLNAKGAST